MSCALVCAADESVLSQPPPQARVTLSYVAGGSKRSAAVPPPPFHRCLAVEVLSGMRGAYFGQFTSNGTPRTAGKEGCVCGTIHFCLTFLAWPDKGTSNWCLGWRNLLSHSRLALHSG